jgi:hypothetical protein
MNTKKLLILFCLLLAACSNVNNDPTPTIQPNLPNPASVYCEEQGYTLETTTAADGSQSSVCVFPDGSKCDEWAYYRGECGPAQEGAPGSMNMPNPASVYCEEQGYTLETTTAADGSQSSVCVFPDGSRCDEWAFYRGECQPGDATAGVVEIASDGCKIYRNESLGYSFHYPENATISINDDPLKSISVNGSLVDGEIWPQFTISHPSDRAEYQPPLDVNLAEWLSENNLVQGTFFQDVEIGGTMAVHVRFDGSPQSYAFDRYFFAKDGQLYVITIGHAGAKEDWDLYNHFLQSFQFNE